MENEIAIRKLKNYYITDAVVLFIMEVLIALVMKDSFVRPYLGDFLVVILLYFIVRIFLPTKAPWLPAAVFAFSVLVEVLQYFHIVEILHLSDIAFFRVLIGGTFDIKDILCYFAGCTVCFLSYYSANAYILRAKTEGSVPGFSYDPELKKPVLKCSICNGEQVAGFVIKETGVFEDEMLIRSEADLKEFKKKYGIEGDLEKIY